MRKQSPVLQEKLAALVVALGYEWVGCEFAQENRNTLFRVYIDSLNGVTVQDCSKVSRQIGAMLDVENLVLERYTLEVSSPGINRPLFELEQYQKQQGRRIKVRLHTPVEQQRNFVGILQRIEGEHIYLLLEKEREVALPFSEVEKANVIADVSL